MTQYSYDPFDFLSQAEADFKVGNRVSGLKGDFTALNLAHYYAIGARDEHYHRARKQGDDAHRHTLKNQLEKYQSMGVDGRGYRDVYFLDVYGYV